MSLSALPSPSAPLSTQMGLDPLPIPSGPLAKFPPLQRLLFFEDDIERLPPTVPLRRLSFEPLPVTNPEWDGLHGHESGFEQHTSLKKFVGYRRGNKIDDLFLQTWASHPQHPRELQPLLNRCPIPVLGELQKMDQEMLVNPNNFQGQARYRELFQL